MNYPDMLLQYKICSYVCSGWYKNNNKITRMFYNRIYFMLMIVIVEIVKKTITEYTIKVTFSIEALDN